MEKIPVIALFDIGKTNKKVLLLNQQYQLVWEYATRLPEMADEDGDPCESLSALTEWVYQQLDAVLALPGFEVKAVNCSAYGASLVYIDENGQPLTPLYSYLKPYPSSLQHRFFRTHVTEEEFSLETASPVLGSLNSGLQLYRVKYFQPRVFKNIQYALHLPQYISWLISGNAVAELTSIGCHTGLWDFRRDDYHQWVYEEEIAAKFPALVAAEQVVSVQRGSHQFLAGSGLHDSSAALIPYLHHSPEPFVLVSTGTWSISLNPFTHTPLTAEELAQDCLCYLSYQGKPVKASRLFLGYWHEEQVKKLNAYYNKGPEEYKNIQPDTTLVLTLLDTECGQTLDSWSPAPYGDFVTAYHALVIRLAGLQQKRIQLISTEGPVKKLYIDGGFSGNALFTGLLATLFPDTEVYTASMAQGTALGAALAIHPAWNPDTEPKPLFETKRCVPFFSLHKKDQS